MGLVVLTGASGAGKTTIAQAFAGRHPTLAEVHFFDRIGVPNTEQMLARYGSPEEWQRLKTIDWLKKLAFRMQTHPNILFEGQTRLAFVRRAAIEAKIDDVQIVLVDCDDATRIQRLTYDRQQPELANERMMNWARFLRSEAEREGAMIFNTSNLSIDQVVEGLRAYFDPPRTGSSRSSRAPPRSSSR